MLLDFQKVCSTFNLEKIDLLYPIWIKLYKICRQNLYKFTSILLFLIISTSEKLFLTLVYILDRACLTLCLQVDESDSVNSLMAPASTFPTIEGTDTIKLFSISSCFCNVSTNQKRVCVSVNQSEESICWHQPIRREYLLYCEPIKREYIMLISTNQKRVFLCCSYVIGQK